MAVVGKGGGEPETGRGIDWRLLLAWFMRTMALGWLAVGLWAWCAILGVEYLDFPAFETQPALHQTVTIVFALIDPVAAVGLWLLAPWGGVVWVIAAGARLATAFALPAAFGMTPAAAGSLGACVAIYLILLWLAHRDRED